MRAQGCDLGEIIPDALDFSSAHHDVSAELLRALADRTDPVTVILSPDAGYIPPDRWEELVSALRESMPRHVTVAVDAPVPLLGAEGLLITAVRRGDIDAGEAAGIERRMHEVAASLKPARTTLLGAEPVDGPASGLGGGLGYLLMMAGARPASFVDLCLPVTALNSAEVGIALVDECFLDLPPTLGALTQRAERVGVPVVGIYRDGLIPRSERARLGLASQSQLDSDLEIKAAITKKFAVIAPMWSW